MARVEDDLLGALSPTERATLSDLLQQAVGARTPPCDSSDDQLSA
jgi:hypothetical protein